MGWTNPRTWVALEKPSAATMNTHIRDNLLALSTWTAYTPTWTNVTIGTPGQINTASYVQAGKVVTVKFMLTLGTGGSFTGVPAMSLPASLPAASSGLLGLGTAIADDSASAPARRTVTVYQNGSTTTVAFIASGDDAGTKIVTTGNPFTWAAGDTLAGTFTYEAA